MHIYAKLWRKGKDKPQIQVVGLSWGGMGVYQVRGPWGGSGALALECAVVPSGGENMGMKYLTCIFLMYIVV